MFLFDEDTIIFCVCDELLLLHNGSKTRPKERLVSILMLLEHSLSCFEETSVMVNLMHGACWYRCGCWCQ